MLLIFDKKITTVAVEKLQAVTIAIYNAVFLFYIIPKKYCLEVS